MNYMEKEEQRQNTSLEESDFCGIAQCNICHSGTFDEHNIKLGKGNIKDLKLGYRNEPKTTWLAWW